MEEEGNLKSHKISTQSAGLPLLKEGSQEHNIAKDGRTPIIKDTVPSLSTRPTGESSKDNVHKIDKKISKENSF